MSVMAVTRLDVSGLFSPVTFALLRFPPRNPMPPSGVYSACGGLSRIYVDAKACGRGGRLLASSMIAMIDEVGAISQFVGCG